MRLRFTPRQPGFYRLRLSLDGLRGERRLVNNAAFASVWVRPPRRRVLFVASRLGHDYRRLRRLFQSWEGPPVEMVADFVRPKSDEEGLPGEWPSEKVLRRWLD